MKHLSRHVKDDSLAFFGLKVKFYKYPEELSACCSRTWMSECVRAEEEEDLEEQDATATWSFLPVIPFL